MRRAIIAGSVLAAVFLVSFGVWKGVKRIDSLEAQLEAANRRTADMQREMQQQVKLTQMTAESAAAARDEAAQAAEAASKQATARERAEAEREQAEREARLARERASATQEELAAVRKRRSEELDRMQEALNRIAPTRRTASGMVVELANDSFQFDFDRAELRAQNREVLSRIAGVLLASEGYRIFVYGHTDDTGTEEYNQGLSERRAKSVRDYLAAAGLPSDVMEVKGFGKSNPRVPNATQAGRQKNRRVEIGIVDSIIQYGEVRQ